MFLLGIDTSINEVVFSNFKFKNDFKVTLINPLQTSHLRKDNIRDAKNDNINSLNIINSLFFTKLNFVSEKNIQCLSLKNLLDLEVT